MQQMLGEAALVLLQPYVCFLPCHSRPGPAQMLVPRQAWEGCVPAMAPSFQSASIQGKQVLSVMHVSSLV